MKIQNKLFFGARRVFISSVLLFCMFGVAQGGVSVHSASGDCTGVVFRDYNSDGVRQMQGDPHPNGIDVYDLEPGESDIIITAYDDLGVQVGQTVSQSDGSYNLSTSLTTGSRVRVEITWSAAYLESAPHGADSQGSVQFAQTGSCNIDFGVMSAGDYCQNTVHLATPCYGQGEHDLARNIDRNDAVVSWNYDWGQETPDPSYDGSNWQSGWQVDSSDNPAMPNKLIDSGSVGTIWGEAWNRQDNYLYLASFMKTGADFGPGGPGMIYRLPMDPYTGQVTGAAEQFVDVGADLGFSMCADPHGLDLVDITVTAPTLEDATFSAVGECSLGDIDVSDDGTKLYVVNLTSRDLIEIDIATKTTTNSWNYLGATPEFTMPSCNNPSIDFIPFAVEWHEDKIYTGGVCTAESTGNKFDIHAYIYEVDPFSGTVELILDYNIFAESNHWFAKYPDLSTAAANVTYSGDRVWGAWPALTDIDFVGDDLAFGFRDMMADAIGRGMNVPEFDAASGTSGNLWQTPSDGDLVCASYDSATDTYSIESGNSCGDRVGTSGHENNRERSTTDSTGLEFYQDGGDSSLGTSHNEAHLGGIESIPGRPLVQTITNPPEAAGQDPRIVWGAGVLWNNNNDGTFRRGYSLYQFESSAGINPAGSFAKGGGLGDVEALCLAAPVEIGNYVWLDIDNDGIQDPSESAISGATVNLYDGTGTLITSTTTNVNGNYWFSSAGPDGLTGTSDDLFLSGDSLIIRMDNQSDYNSGGPLESYIATISSADLDDDADSDAQLGDLYSVGNGSYPEIQATIGSAGENDHTYDFGYSISTSAPDLALTKTIATEDQAVTVGDTVQFTLTVTNQGDIDAYDILVSDYIPAGFELTAANQGSWNAAGAGPLTVNQTIPGPIAAYDGTTYSTESITIDLTVTSAATSGELTNIAEISQFLDAAGGTALTDIDSTPDTDSTNDAGSTDDDTTDDVITGDGTGTPGDDVAATDEDDADAEDVVVQLATSIDIDKQLYRGHDSGVLCNSEDAADELIIVNKEPILEDVTYCFTVTNTGNTSLGSISITDPVIGITHTDMTLLLSESMPLAPGDTISYFYEHITDTSIDNTASALGTPVYSSGTPTGQPDVSAEDINAVLAYVFDPPSGVKTGTLDGDQPIITWDMVWINNSTITADSVVITDTPPEGSSYLGGLRCSAGGSSVVHSCYYEDPSVQFPSGRVIAVADIAPDTGETDPYSALNAISITFDVVVDNPDIEQTFENQAQLEWNGEVILSDDPEVSGDTDPTVLVFIVEGLAETGSRAYVVPLFGFMVMTVSIVLFTRSSNVVP